MTTPRARVLTKEGGSSVKARERGSILVEAVMGLLFVILPLFAFQIELLRLAQYHALFHKMTFHYVRFLALGESERAAKQEAGRIPRAALSQREAKHLVRFSDFIAEENSHRLEGRIRYRYAGFFSFWKPRIQLTKSCQFYLSH